MLGQFGVKLFLVLAGALWFTPVYSQGGAREVQISIYVVNIQRIDDAEQTVTVDFALRLAWNDPSLVNATADAVRYIVPTEIWVPDIQILGDVNLVNRRPNVVEVDKMGNAVLRKRLVGDLTVPFDYSDFPFDQHTFSIQAVYVGHDPVSLNIDEAYSGQQGRFTIPDWWIATGSPRVFEFKVNNTVTPALAFDMPVQRRGDYYVWKMLVPLSTVVFMSWMVFWISPKLVVPRVAISYTSILAIIAYRFTLGLLVPRLPYFTRLDVFITGVSIMVFLTLAEAVVVANLMNSPGKESAAPRWDSVCRWAFPAVFVLLLYWAFLR